MNNTPAKRLKINDDHQNKSLTLRKINDLNKQLDKVDIDKIYKEKKYSHDQVLIYLSPQNVESEISFSNLSILKSNG